MASNIVPFPRRHANDNHNPNPPQPGLKAFVMMDHLPDGCIAHLITDSETNPLLRPGDVIIVDTTDRTPELEELFLIEWASSGRRAIVTVWQTPSFLEDYWVGPYLIQRNWQKACEASRTPPVRFGDGPYPADALAKKFVGRIVGLLDAAYEEPQRIAA